MKRRFLLIGLVAAISTLTNCTQEIDQPIDTTEVSQGIPFEIVASPAETKLTLDGLTAVWEEGDALNVFHAEASTTTYVDDGSFTLTENDVFSGNLTSAPTGETDWYAMYPYSQYLETPNNNNGAYYSVWNKNSMTQSGNNNNSHLCGNGFPMYGKGTFGQDEAVVIEMEHVASVVKVVVTNSLEEPLTVTDVTFTAPVDIVGQYYINIAGEEATFTPRGESYVNSIASLIVSEGGAIEEDASAEFYIGLRPFTAASGSTLKISVNGTEKSIVLPNDVTFSPGKIKTLNFNYDVETPPTEATVTEFLSAEESSVWYQLEGVITDISNPTHGNFDLVDETGSVYVYGVLPSKGAEKGQFSTLGLKEGDVVTIIGNRGSHNSNPQVTNAYYVGHVTAVDAPVIAFADNTVTLTCATDGATIYYTTDGTDPVTSDTKVTYSAPFTIDETCTVMAYAAKESMPNSIIVSQECALGLIVWNLSTNQTNSVTDNLVTWTSEYATMSLSKGSSATKANNYLGGIGGNTHTRFYKDHVLSIEPKDGYAIESIEIISTTDDYANEFVESAWINASAMAEGQTITVLLANGTDPISVTISAATRATSVKVSFVEVAEYVAPSLESIAVSNQNTEFTVGDEFSFSGNVTATYSNGVTSDVTSSPLVKFSGYNMDEVGEQEVTVTYEGKTTTYSITVNEGEEDEENESASYYVKVTKTPSDWSGKYLIVYEDENMVFNGNLTTLDAVNNYISVGDITDNKIQQNTTSDAASFTINASGHIKSASGYYIGQTSDTNGLKSSTSKTYTNTLSLNIDSTVNIVSGGAYLRFNTTSGQDRFRYYKTTSYTDQKAICLYKLKE